MFNRIFNHQSKTVFSAAVILGAASLVSRILGLIRESIFAAKFGAGDVMDIYNAAFLLPDLVYNLLVLGALSAGFIPVFSSYLQKNRDFEAWYLANGLLNMIVISTVIIGGFLALLAPWLTPLTVPGFGPEKTALTINLSRLMFLSSVFLAASAVFGDILQSFKKFFVYSLAPIFYNFGIIFGALVLADFWGAYGLGAGVILGAILHMLLQALAAVSSGFRYGWVWDFYHSGIRRIGRLMVPRVLSLAAGQLDLIIMTVIGSTLVSGSIAIFTFAYNLQSLPWGVIGVSFSLAVFPVLSQSSAKKDWPDFLRNFSGAFRQILFLIIPLSVLLLVLRTQIVQAVFGHGFFGLSQFSPRAVVLTSQSLFYFSLGLFALGLNPLLWRAFFSLENSKTPLLIGFIASSVNVAGSLILIRYLSVAGLALAFALASLVRTGLAWIFLKKEVRKFFALSQEKEILDERRIFLSLVKIISAGLSAGLAAYGTLFLIAPLLNLETFLGIFIQGLAAGLAGLLVYVLLAFLLRMPEMTGWRRA